MVRTTGTPKARALGAELRAVREEAGIGLREFARRLGLSSHSVLARWESGESPPTVEEVATILGALTVVGERRDEILALARDTGGSVWVAMSLPEQQRQLSALLDFERTATTITDVSPLLVPGLLQTGDYARAIMVAGEVSADQIETRVAVRGGRRETVTRRRSPARLTALIGEAALYQKIGGPEVMADQLYHLQDMAKLPTVDIRVVPFDAGWHPALVGAFLVIEFETATPVVHVETSDTGMFLHEKNDVAAYQKAATKVLRLAMSPTESIDLIAREAKRIERIA